MALKFLNNGYFAGKVGIGTQTPLRGDLVVKGNFQTVSSGNGQLAIISGVLGSNPSDADVGGQMVFGGPISSSDSNRTFGLVGGYKENNTSGDRSGYLSFGTRQNTGSRDIFERMRITSGGNVGIGTITPDSKLDVTGGDITVNTSGVGFMNFKYGSVGSESTMGSIQTTGIDLKINATSDLLLLPGSNVGIGTTSPTRKLEVDFTGSVYGAKFARSDAAGSSLIEFANSAGVKSIIGYDAGVDGYKIGTASATNLVVKQSGNVGIGTTSPGAKLEISHSGSNDGLLLENTNNVNNYQIALNIRENEGLIYQRWTGGAFNANLMRIGYTGAITFDAYNSTNQTGTPTYLLGTDASGNIVKTNTVPGSAAGPYLPLAGGTMTGTNGVLMPDNFRLKIGTSEDLLIFHDGTDSQIFNQAGDLKIRNDQNDGDIVFMSDNGSGGTTEYFRVDGGEVETLFSKTTHHSDNIQARFGDAGDLRIYHDGSNNISFIKNSNAGGLRLQSDELIIFAANGTTARADFDIAVKLFYNDSKKFETTNTGVTVTGEIKIDSALLSNQENTDVDTGTETVASVAIATYTAAFFDFVIKKTTNVRSGTVYACHDGTNVQFTETSTQDLGDTSDVTLSVDISGGNMRLRATTTSDDWSIKSLIRAI